MTLNCIIVDDEPMARKLLQEYIEETDFLKLSGVAENPLKAIPLLASPEIDLMFLDVNMPKMSGMDFLRSSPNLPMVILTTAYTQYALEGFEMAVVDYLAKPFPLERFIAAAMKALDLKTLRTQSNKKGQDNAEYFYIKSNGRIERILYGDLLYIEAMSNYVTLYTVQTKFTAYLTVKGIL
jgi:DNA-binding LytR/AlgR family response regulator